MRLAPALLLCPFIAWAAEPGAPTAAKAAEGAGEPNVQHIVVEDDNARIEELRVRGQTQSIVVTSKLGGRYEIFMGEASRDIGDASASHRGAAGQRMWRLLSF
jgi:hypothetical protein